MQDKNVKETQIGHLKEIITIQEKLKSNQNRMSTLRDKIEDLHKQYKEIESASETRDSAQEFHFRAKARELNNACKEFDSLHEEDKIMTKTLQVKPV